MPVDSSPSPLPAPAALCLLRTSAIGDVTHVVPLVRTLQRAWPQTALTWVVGKLERRLVGDIEGVEFVTFDKGAGLAGMRAVWNALRGRRFDALLQMQVAALPRRSRSRLLTKVAHLYKRPVSRRAVGQMFQLLAAQCFAYSPTVVQTLSGVRLQ